jgi:hypothetical protein
MDHFIDGQNPYELLGLENGQQSTLQDIKTVCMLWRGRQQQLMPLMLWMEA